ncbi:Pam16-domain-containing protein [Podospora australis]|uniref:Mitochondrial import inner membrane translocase subunit TIM16 n=1 Tax=Podospora australis TaxID=1536484 RepID=A0AAN6WQN7_9PEZI|nr:Pam16-domain-containing protein [Podospora australis]
MAYKLVTQVVLIGTRVLGRAFAEAYKQAAASSQYQRAQQKAGNGSGGSGMASLSSGMTLDEACKILNVKPPQGAKTDVDEVMDRFKRLFDANDPTKGGSFYLQSKILRARERIEAEVRPHLEKAAQEAEVKEGWNPKLYKDSRADPREAEKAEQEKKG